MDSTAALILLGSVTAAVAIIGLLFGVWRWLRRPSKSANGSMTTSAEHYGAAATGGQAASATTGGIAAARDVTVIQQSGMSDKEGERLSKVEDRQEEIERLLLELQESTTIQPEGTHKIGPEELAKVGGPDMSALLREALKLKREHKEHDSIERLLTAYDMDMPDVAKAQLHSIVGNSFLNIGEVQAAEGHYSQALNASREGGSVPGEVDALIGLALVFDGRGDFEQATSTLEKAASIASQESLKTAEGAALGNLGIMRAKAGDPEGAISYFDQARQKADEKDEALYLGNMGNVYAMLKDLTNAGLYYQKSLELHRRDGNQVGEAQALAGLAIVQHKEGDLHAARELYGQSLDIFRNIGQPAGEAQNLANIGNTYVESGQLAEAEEHHQQALDIFRETGDRYGEASQLGNLGVIRRRQGDTEEACSHLRASLALFEGIGATADIEKTASAIKTLGCD